MDEAGLPLSPSSTRLPTVHLLCGMICSGKSSIAQELAKKYNAMVFSPDTWILSLYGPNFPVEQFSEVGDNIKNLIWRQAQEVIARYGSDVILDFSLWEYEDRESWRRRILEDSFHWYSGNSGMARLHYPVVERPTIVEDIINYHSSDPEYHARYCSPFVRVQLHFADCPVSTCRARLADRNLHAAANKSDTSLCIVTKTSPELEEKCLDPPRMLDVPSEAPTDLPSPSGSSSHISSLTQMPYVLNHSHSDRQNFLIAVDTFDRWSSILQPPLPCEYAIVWRNGQCYSAIHTQTHTGSITDAQAGLSVETVDMNGGH